MHPIRSWISKLGALPAIVIVVGVSLSAWAALETRDRAAQTAQTKFDSLTHAVGIDVVRRFTLPLYGLRGVAGMLAASQGLDGNEFRTLVDAMVLESQYPGVRGFGLIHPVPRSQAAAYVRAARADGAPDFEIRELGGPGTDDHYVIRYIEPLQNNRPAVGLDVGSEANRRRAIERAIDSGQPALTDPITLVQDDRQSPGFLLYLPAYHPGRPMATAAQRRAALIGVVYAPIVAAELLDGARAGSEWLIDIRIEHAGSGGLVYDSAYVPVAGESPRPPSEFEAQKLLDVVGSRFQLATRSGPGSRVDLPLAGIGLRRLDHRPAGLRCALVGRRATRRRRQGPAVVGRARAHGHGGATHHERRHHHRRPR